MGGGEVKFYPYKKGGMEKILAMLKGGTTRVVLTQDLEVLAIMMRGCKKCPSCKRGAQNVLPCLERGGAQNVLNPQLSHFVPPSP